MATSAIASRRKSILIVEDEAMIAMMLEEFVDTLGHHVHGIATTVDQGCQMVADGGFDFAILDCHLAGNEVWPVARMLEDRSIPYILSSGGSISEVPSDYASRPMLSKPFTIAAIADLLQAI